MSIERRGGQWYFRFQWRGREVRRPTNLDATEQNRKEAEEMEALYRSELRLGHNPGAVRRRNFRTAAEEYLQWCESTEYRGRLSTFLRIKTSFASILQFFAEVDVSDVQVAHVEDYKAWRVVEHQVRDCTVRNDLITLGKFFKWAAGRHYCAGGNPCDQVKRPSPRPGERFHILTPAEEAAYFQAALAESKSLHDLAMLILLTGCRPEELLGARCDQVDLKAKTLFIPGGKTKAARRSLDLVSEAMEIVRWRVKASPSSAWLFPSPRRSGEHLTKLNAQHDEACRQSGCSFRLYDLRHTFATRMIEAGVSLPALATILGHSGLSIVTWYVHPSRAHQVEAMAKYQSWLKAQVAETKKKKA